jgi:hypothetical protein
MSVHVYDHVRHSKTGAVREFAFAVVLDTATLRGSIELKPGLFEASQNEAIRAAIMRLGNAMTSAAMGAHGFVDKPPSASKF